MQVNDGICRICHVYVIFQRAGLFAIHHRLKLSQSKWVLFLHLWLCDVNRVGIWYITNLEDFWAIVFELTTTTTTTTRCLGPVGTQPPKSLNWPNSPCCPNMTSSWVKVKTKSWKGRRSCCDRAMRYWGLRGPVRPWVLLGDFLDHRFSEEVRSLRHKFPQQFPISFHQKC